MFYNPTSSRESIRCGIRWVAGSMQVNIAKNSGLVKTITICLLSHTAIRISVDIDAI